MDCFDFIIIGAGPAGVSAAYALRNKSVLMLDVGYTCSEERLAPKNLYDLKRTENVYDLILGKDFESLEHFSHGYLSPKLKGPLMRYITRIPELLSGIDSGNNFEAQQSFAKGGLANAWGAGLMRYGSADLKDFPISPDDLDPFYDELTALVGISGDKDDLRDYFGSDAGILPPLNLSPLCQNFLNKYNTFKASRDKSNILVGRPRLAVLSRDYNGRPAYPYHNQDFFQPHNPSVFNPAFLLDDILRHGKINYRPSSLVTEYFENGEHVEVRGVSLDTNEPFSYTARHIILAAGTLNTTRIVLRSHKDFTTRLPILDNAIAFIPFVDIGLVGKKFVPEVFPGAELCVVASPNSPIPLQSSVYGLSGTLRGDLVSEFPLSIRSNIRLTKYLGPALGMMQVFFPDYSSKKNYISLKENGGFHVNYEQRQSLHLSPLVSFLHGLRYFTSSLIIKKPAPGSSIHYAGTLPMRKEPTHRYETNIDGTLAGSKRVHIVDGSVFPRLPSKNHSFTIMANAMRVVNCILKNM